MKLWVHQAETYAAIKNSWRKGAYNVLAVLPTGSGKTILFTKIMADLGQPCVAIAHRQELVGQISFALAQHNVRHRIVGQSNSIRFITKQHIKAFGRSYYEPLAPIGVASVDTLLRRKSQLASWRNQVRLWVQDEGHHIQRSNKWGKAALMFPLAIGLAVTATPCRADGRGLGRDTDGIIDDLVVGQSMREVIRAGHLTDYRIFSIRNDHEFHGLDVSAQTGDYSRQAMAADVRKAGIFGDIVEHYQRIAPGKLGLTFVPDVQTGAEVAAAYNAAGVRAEVVSYKTADVRRAAILEKFRNREILQLVNVDLFGEGFDLPAVEVVSFARPTASFSLYAQQFGRALRILDGKLHALIIDHVGNVKKHGLPDARKHWSLARRERRAEKDPDIIPTRTCINPTCTLTYERIYKACPYCGFRPMPAQRSGPEFVDGDLDEIDPVTLAQMRGEIAAVDMIPEEYRLSQTAKHAHPVWIEKNLKSYLKNQEMQTQLRAHIAQWAGYQRADDRPDSESYRRFYFRYGTDVMTAQTLKHADALKLSETIARDINEGKVL